MNNLNPSIIFGFGTWEQIVDRFLYCSDSSGTTGGSSTHNHTLNSGYARMGFTDGFTSFYQSNYTGYVNRANGTSSTNWWGWYNVNMCALGGTTDDGSTMPPYITVYAWQRIA